MDRRHPPILLVDAAYAVISEKTLQLSKGCNEDETLIPALQEARSGIGTTRELAV